MSAGGDSPCVGVCAIEEASGLCRGCARTLAEIAAWPRLNAAQRRALLAELAARRSAAQPG